MRAAEWFLQSAEDAEIWAEHGWNIFRVKTLCSQAMQQSNSLY